MPVAPSSITSPVAAEPRESSSAPLSTVPEFHPDSSLNAASATLASSAAAPSADTFAPIPGGVTRALDFANMLQSQQQLIGGGMSISRETAEAALYNSLPAHHRQLSIRHVRAWGRFIAGVCNEAAQSDANQPQMRVPPGIAMPSTPDSLRAHRQTRAHHTAMERLAKATSAMDSRGELIDDEAQMSMANDDIEELDSHVRALMRDHEDAIQKDVSDQLLRSMLLEVAGELHRIGVRESNRRM